jgi:hypothetical protein
MKFDIAEIYIRRNHPFCDSNLQKKKKILKYLCGLFFAENSIRKQHISNSVFANLYQIYLSVFLFIILLSILFINFITY